MSDRDDSYQRRRRSIAALLGFAAGDVYAGETHRISPAEPAGRVAAGRTGGVAYAVPPE